MRALCQVCGIYSEVDLYSTKIGQDRPGVWDVILMCDSCAEVAVSRWERAGIEVGGITATVEDGEEGVQ